MPQKDEGDRGTDRAARRPTALAASHDKGHRNGGEELTGILSERIDNLKEAIQELDDALAARKTLNTRFLRQIDDEMNEIRHQLGHLQPPWKAGFEPQLEFLRLSFHKSLTSRRKDSRTEEHSYWKDGIDLLKEKRKFLDEYKALLSTKKRLIE